MSSAPTGQASVRELNAAQRAAVEHLHGPLLVVAGAGTGKTRVITERVRYLLDTLPDLQGENILAVTYTNKAAAEMQQRIRRRTDRRGEGVLVSTFHAFCHNLLREHNRSLTLVDDTDYWIFLRRRLDQLGLEIFKHLSEPGRFLSDFIQFFSRCQDELVSPADYSSYAEGLAAALAREESSLAEEERAQRREEVARQQEIARVYAAAEKLLRQQNRTTFGGLLFRAVALLRTDAELREHYQERFRYILVDEFQDANVAQIELLSLLAGRHRNLMAVGDDDQAIYRFRGASYATFSRFAQLYPDYRVITLTQNYRSTRRILRVAAELIAQNGQARFQQDKKVVACKPPGMKVRTVEATTPTQEAAYVHDAIKRACDPANPEPRRYGDFAVLYRTHRHRRALVEMLTRAGIPFVIRNLSILDNTLIRDLLAYLRVVDRPEDNVNFARLLAIPAWRLTPEQLLDLAARAQRDKVSLYHAAESLHPSVRIEHTRLEELLELIRASQLRAGELPVTTFFDELIERLGLRLLPSDPDRAYLEEFADFLHRWEKEKSETRRLRELVEYLDYFEEAGGNISLPEKRAAGDAVQLMTVHGAKGLEFNTVFVLRLNRGDFPVRKRRRLFEFPAALMKEALPPGDFHVQEERRLCYVGFTRAQEQLTLLTVADDRRPASIFLEDILRDPRVLTGVEQISPPPSRPRASVAEGAAVSDSQQKALFGRPEESRAYSRITSWATTGPLPPLEEPLSLSHSALETYATCPLKYQFAYRWRIATDATPALLFGQIMHRVLAQFFQARQRQPQLPFAELAHIYEQQWRQTHWPFRDVYQQQQYREAGHKQLQAFYERHRSLRLTVLEQEKRFRWRYQDVELTGRIDQLNRLQGKEVEIVEYKTGRPHTPREVERSLQLALYAAATEAVLGLAPVRLTLYSLATNNPISVEASDKRRLAVLERVRQVAGDIRAGKFPARPNYHCRFCDYQRICPEYEQPTALFASSDSAWAPAARDYNRESDGGKNNWEPRKAPN
ncbi:MAG: ATP-dependent helicase [Terriglobia bacterium]